MRITLEYRLNSHEDIMKFGRKIREEELDRSRITDEGRMHAEEQLKQRHQKLYMGMLYGNNFNKNVRIVFNTEDGAQEVCSRVWATTDRHVVLGSGTFLPISAIIDILID
ncbi:MAG: hypothetical protein U0T84_02650 [Chitinophagales bacterium]